MSRTKQQWEATSRMVAQLQAAGITYEDAWQLRKISMTLTRWFEGECGNSDTHGSWAIVRGWREKLSGGHLGPFLHSDHGTPYLERHPHQGPPTPRYTPIPDREKGARKRLAKIMANYPTLGTYIQGDPRGCALHVLRPGDVPSDGDVSGYYSRGIAVHQ